MMEMGLMIKVMSRQGFDGDGDGDNYGDGESPLEMLVMEIIIIIEITNMNDYYPWLD